jgi:hypothetical protein
MNADHGLRVGLREQAALARTQVGAVRAVPLEAEHVVHEPVPDFVGQQTFVERRPLRDSPKPGRVGMITVYDFSGVPP